MNKEPSCIKLLLKYYNYSKDNNNTLINSTTIEYNKTTSNSNITNYQNYRYSINSILSNDKENNNTIKNNRKNTDNIDNKIYNNKTFNVIGELTQDYLIHFKTNYPYINLENKYPPKILNIKACIYLYLLEKKKLNVTMDSLLLFKYIHGKYHLLNDEDNFSHQINSKIKSNLSCTNIHRKKNQNKNENNISNSTTIYYYINKEKVTIDVELFSKSIDRISLNISKSCSLLMLKFLILLKLKEIDQTKNITDLIEKNNDILTNNNFYNDIDIITMDEIEKKVNLYGNGILNGNLTSYLYKKETNRNFHNNYIISDIYTYYSNNSYSITDDNSNNKIADNFSISKDDLDEGILSFIMMEQKGTKCCLGLDFRFTILQNFLPISDDAIEEEKNDLFSFKTYLKNDAPITQLGLNLYFFCLNKECKYNTKYFIINVGYGNYDIFNFIKYNAFCPICYKSKQEFLKEKGGLNEKNDFNNLNLKYIGMENAKWVYKGFLIGIKMTVVEGKGLTALKDILYKTDEFDYLHQFRKLVFQIERYHPKNKYNPNYIGNDTLCSDDFNIINDIPVNNGKNAMNEKKQNTNENVNVKINNDKQKINRNKEELIVNNRKKYEIFVTDINNNRFDGNTISTNSNKKVLKKSISFNDKIINYRINNEYQINNKMKMLMNYDNSGNFIIDNNEITINNESKQNLDNSNNNINDYNNNIKQILNYDYNNAYIKKNKNLNVIPSNKKINNSKRTFLTNGKQNTQIGDGNETYNTDFNIIIDKTKSNCCENCFECHKTQFCHIF